MDNKTVTLLSRALTIASTFGAVGLLVGGIATHNVRLMMGSGTLACGTVASFFAPLIHKLEQDHGPIQIELQDFSTGTKNTKDQNPGTLSKIKHLLSCCLNPENI